MWARSLLLSLKHPNLEYRMKPKIRAKALDYLLQRDNAIDLMHTSSVLWFLSRVVGVGGGKVEVGAGWCLVLGAMWLWLWLRHGATYLCCRIENQSFLKVQFVRWIQNYIRFQST